MKLLSKLFWKCVYTFNRNILGRFLPGIIIGNSYLYEDSDEYVKLTSDGWVIIKSKSHKEYSDMIPITMVSEGCLEILIKSSFFNSDRIINEMKRGDRNE